MIFWLSLAVIQTLIGIIFSVSKQKRSLNMKQFSYLFFTGFCLFFFSPLAGIIAAFLLIDKIRAGQIEKMDLACSDEGRAIRTMLKASQIRMKG
jgi:hypothetical protein